MKIIPLQQLNVSDFPQDQQKWLPQLFGPLNQFLTAITTALEQNLAFNDNTQGQEQDLSFTYGTTTLPQSFKLTMSTTPLSLIVSAATENKVPVILLVAWQYVNGQVQLTDIAKVASGVISQLKTGASYTLRVRLEA